MYCKHCGKTVEAGAKFCKYCGQPVEEQPMQEQPQHLPEEKEVKKKKSILTGAVILCAVIGLMIIAIGGMNISLGSKFKRLETVVHSDNVKECMDEFQHIEEDWKKTGVFSFGNKKDLLNQLESISEQSAKYVELLTEAQQYVDNAESNLKSYAFAEEEYKRYQDDVNVLKNKIAGREAADIQKSLDQADQDYDAWMQAGKDYIKEKIEEYQNVNLATADSSDKETIQNAVEQLSNLIQEENVNFDETVEIISTADESYLRYVEPENYLSIQVQQIDVTDYPNVKLYVNVKDSFSNEIDNLNAGMFYVRKQDANGNYIKQQVKEVNQLNEIEALNINMLADVSGSMSGSPLDEAKMIMNSFINSVQFSVGDMVALTSFSNGVYINQDFTNDAGRLKNAVNNLYTQNMTSFYDALYTSVNKVAAKSGAKCVIAFTDGMDNFSSCKPEDVISLAQRYHVPIFVIGIGYEDYSIARNIAIQTGGNYYSAISISDMNYIYNQIYKQEKELYMLEFEDTTDVGVFNQSSIVLGYHTAEYGGETDYSYTPNTLVSVNNSSIYKDGPEAVVASYMVAFADAMTNQDYSCIAPYILSGSALETEQKKYVARGISEIIDSYEIENVEYTDTNNCVVTTRETYFVQKANAPLALLTQRCKYNVVKSGNDWKMTSFAGKVEVLSKIAY